MARSSLKLTNTFSLHSSYIPAGHCGEGKFLKRPMSGLQGPQDWRLLCALGKERWTGIQESWLHASCATSPGTLTDSNSSQPLNEAESL